MPTLTKQDYEKVTGKKYTNEQFAKVSAALAKLDTTNERPSGASAGATLKDATSRDGRALPGKQPEGAYAKTADGKKVKIHNGLAGVDAYDYPGMLAHPAAVRLDGTPLAAQPMTEAERLRAELGGGTMTGYVPKPAPLQGVVLGGGGIPMSAAPKPMTQPVLAPPGAPLLANVPPAPPAKYASGTTMQPGDPIPIHLMKQAPGVLMDVADAGADMVEDRSADFYDGVGNMVEKALPKKKAAK